jgi:hypothetical protein
MPKISVITPSVRRKGLRIVLRALLRQSFQDFEWLIGSEFIPRELNHRKGWVRWIPDKFKGGFWSLNRVYNKLIENTKGELIVSWQDYTFAKPECLSRFLNCYYKNPNIVVGGVGHKYQTGAWNVVTWQDPRARQDQGSFYECYPWDVEANLCAVPKQAFYDIGGFDEKMDFEGFGFDARGVFERLDMLGKYKFYLDQSNESFSLEHPRPKGWDKNNMIDKWTEYKKENIDKKAYPVLGYIKEPKPRKARLRHT